MKKPDAPCLGCEDRHAGCHGDCPLYVSYKAEYEDYKQKLRDAGATDFLNMQYQKDKKDKINRVHRRGSGWKRKK